MRRTATTHILTQGNPQKSGQPLVILLAHSVCCRNDSTINRSMTKANECTCTIVHHESLWDGTPLALWKVAVRGCECTPTLPRGLYLSPRKAQHSKAGSSRPCLRSELCLTCAGMNAMAPPPTTHTLQVSQLRQQCNQSPPPPSNIVDRSTCTNSSTFYKFIVPPCIQTICAPLAANKPTPTSGHPL